jgi:hypothetical protein
MVWQRIVMPEVEQWATNSGWGGTSFMSCKTPYAYISSQFL